MDTTTTYVGDRRVLDADSHVMELADFLDEFIDPEFKDQLRRFACEVMPAFQGAKMAAE